MVKFHLSEYKPTHSLSDFEFLHDPKDKRSKLGLGSFATVKLAREKKSGKLFALKLMEVHSSKATKSDLHNLKNEILIHKDLNHPNVIKFHGYIQEENTVYLILDYAENGNLYSYHHRKKALTEKEIFRFFHQACLAINYLHENDIVHRDIKPENLLLDKDFNIKICDFGWSAYNISQERTTFCGTYEYMAPELVNKETYDHTVDIWAIGVLLYELIHNKAPYKGRTMQEIKSSLTSGDIIYNNDIPIDAKNLIQKILKNDPKHRLVISEILADQWVAYHLEKEEVFRKTVYQDDVKRGCNTNKHKLKIFDNEEETKKKPITSSTDPTQQLFNISKYLKKGLSMPSGSSTTDKSRSDNLFPINLNKTVEESSADEKESPKSAVFSTTRILEEPKTPKAATQKKIFDDDAIISPSFNDRFNRVINNLTTNNKYSILNMTKSREGISSPASHRIPDNRSKLDVYGSSGMIQADDNNIENKPLYSRDVKSFILDEPNNKPLKSVFEDNLDAGSLRNVSNIQRQAKNNQFKLEDNPFLAVKEPHIIRVDKRNEVLSKNDENQKVSNETGRVKIFNDESKRKMVSKLIEDFSFVKNLLSGPNRTVAYNKEKSTVVKIGQRNL